MSDSMPTARPRPGYQQTEQRPEPEEPEQADSQYRLPYRYDQNPYRFATDAGADSLALLQSTPFAARHNAPSARAKVMQARRTARELHMTEAEILDMLQQQHLVNVDDMSDEELADVVELIGTPGQTPAEAIHAAQEHQQLAADLAWIREYDSDSMLMREDELNEYDGLGLWGRITHFFSGWGDAATRGQRRRRMWNELEPWDRERLMREHGVRPPAIMGNLGVSFGEDDTDPWDEDQYGVNAWVSEKAVGIGHSAWYPVRSLIGLVEKGFQASHRLYRGQLVLDQQQGLRIPDVDPVEDISPEDDVEDAWAATDRLDPTNDWLTEAGHWLRALFTPGRDARRAAAEGVVNPDATISPVVVNRVVEDYGLDDQTAGIAQGIAEFIDPSVYGSPLHRMEQSELTAGRFLQTLRGYTDATLDDVQDAAVEDREVAAVMEAFRDAVDDYLLETMPGTDEVSATQRATARTMLLQSETIRMAANDLAMNGAITFGRQVAGRVGLRPGTTEFNRMSGQMDFLANIWLDPTVGVGGAKYLGQATRMLSTSSAIPSAQRVQDVFDGVRTIPGTGRAVSVPFVGSSFRREVRGVSRAVTETINRRLNAEIGGAGRIVDSIEEAGGVVEEVSGTGRGFDRIARNHPRWVTHYEDLVDDVWSRIQDTIDDGFVTRDDLMMVDDTGQLRLRDGDQALDRIPEQMVVDWMKTTEGTNAILNGALGGVMSKHPTLPSSSLAGLPFRGAKRAASLTLDKLDGLVSNRARTLAERGVFDDHGRNVVLDVVSKLRTGSRPMDDDTADVIEAAVGAGQLDDHARGLLRAELDRHIDEVYEQVRTGGLESGEEVIDLELVRSKLDQDNPFREIGRNATGLMGHPKVSQMIHAAAVARFGNLSAIKRLGYGLGAVAWAPIQWANGAVRSFTIVAPSTRLALGTGTANQTIRNYAALLPPEARARLANTFAAGLSESDEVNLARNIVLEVADTLGLPYSQFGRHFMAKQMKFLGAADNMHFSSSVGNNYLRTPARRSAAIRTNDLAEEMLLPSFTKLVHASEQISMFDKVFPTSWVNQVMNSAAMDAFMGRFWSPSVLFRLGFGVRTSADEMLAAAARDGVWMSLQSRLGHSALSDKGVIPYFMRVDRFGLRTLFRGFMIADSMKLRVAKALDLPDDVVEVLEQAQQFGKLTDKRQIENIASARRAMWDAIRYANPYEIVSLSMVNRTERALKWLNSLEWLQHSSFDGVASAYAKLQTVEPAARRRALSWGPEKLTQAWRLVQAGLTQESMYDSVRFLSVHSDDASRGLPSVEELSAAAGRDRYQMQHTEVLGERTMSPSGRRPDPQERMRDMVANGVEVIVRNGDNDPDFIDAMVHVLERDLAGDTTRYAVDVFLDEVSDLGGRYERGQINTGQLRQELFDRIKAQLLTDEKFQETFWTRMDRSRRTRDNRVVIGRNIEDYRATAKLAHSTASDVYHREEVARRLLRGEDLPPEPEGAKFVRDEVRDELETWIDDNGWEVEWFDGTSGRDAFGTTFYDRRKITIYEGEVDAFWGRLEAAVERRNQAMADNGGRLPDDWSDEDFGTAYLNEMGVNPFDVYEWYLANGGKEALREKVYWHEVAHAFLHSERSQANRLALEVEAEELAFSLTGMPFGDRDAAHALLRGRIEASLPPPPTPPLGQRFGEVLRDTPAETADTLDQLADVVRGVSGESMGLLDNAAASAERMTLVGGRLNDLGLSDEHVARLFGQLLDDGPYVATRTVQGPQTYADELRTAVEDDVLGSGLDDLPFSPTVLDAVADYAEYLAAGLRRHGDEWGDVEDVLVSVDDEGIARLFDQLNEDGIEGIDNDFLDILIEQAGGRVAPDAFQRGPRHPMATPLEGDPVLRPGGADGPIVSRPQTTADLLRLSRELTAGQYASAEEAMDDFVMTLVDELFNNWFSSPESVANDLMSGTYQTAPGAKVWMVQRDPSGHVVGVTDPGPFYQMRPSVELVETSEDAEEALSNIRNGRTLPFFRPITTIERKQAKEAVERILHTLMDAVDEMDELYLSHHATIPATFEEFIRYAAITTKRNGGQPDQFTQQVINTIRHAPDDDGSFAKIAPIVDRLVLGAGRDTYARMRPLTTVEELRNAVERFDQGRPMFREEQALEIAHRMPDQTFRPRVEQKYRDILREGIDHGYGVLMPVIDYLNRQPLMGAFYHLGLEQMRPRILNNRPEVRRALETIQDSDRWLSAQGAQRTRYSRNGYVSAKEVAGEIDQFVGRMELENGEKVPPPGHVVASADGPLGKILDEAEVTRPVGNATADWFHDVLLPQLVDDFPPQVLKEATDETDEVLEAFDDYVERVLDVVQETEIHLHDAAMTNAVTNLSNYTDNEAIATLFSAKHRNLFPFYWAEERFIKRVFKTFAYNPAGFARAVATFRGLSTSTILDRDEDGNAIFVYPLSGAAEDWAGRFMRVMAGHEPANFVVPASVERRAIGFWDRVIPGSDEAGLPKNPHGAFGITLRGLWSWHPELEGLLRPVAGPIASNDRIEAWMTILPANLVRVMQAMDPEEVQRIYADEMFTAFAYMYANGMVPDVEEHDSEVWDDFYLSMRNWTQVFAGMAIMYGFGGVTAPQFDVAPDSPQHEWRQYMIRFGFEEGIEQFMRDYPDETLFTMFQTETAGGAPIPATRTVHEFLVEHEDLADSYPEAFGYLIPVPEYTDEFYAPAWAIQQRLGLRRERNEEEGTDALAEIHRDLAFAAAAPEYFQLQEEFDERIEAARQTENHELRRAIENEKARVLGEILKTNPLFRDELMDRQEGVEKRVQTLRGLRELDRKFQNGDERVQRLIDDNPRMELTLEMLREYDLWRQMREEWQGYESVGRMPDILSMSKQSFLEWGEVQTREHPELKHFWERIIVAEINGYDPEDIDEVLLGLDT